MNRKFFSSVLAIAAIFTNISVAAAGPFDKCTLETRKDKRTSGRMIWNPKASHFNQAVIITSRDFFPYPPKVELFTIEEKRIETTRLKSTGLCAGWHECLFAATYLAKNLGSRYQNKYGPIFVKVTPSKITSKTPNCRYYQIANPKKRAEFHR